MISSNRRASPLITASRPAVLVAAEVFHEVHS